jgi:myb proto-oncogene protein
LQPSIIVAAFRSERRRPHKMMPKRSCGPKKRLRRGLWSPEEDEKLMNHIAKYGNGCWSSVPKIAGTRPESSYIDQYQL